jgi:hypothetical protein
VLAILVLAILTIVTIVLFSAGGSAGTCSEEDLQLAQQIPPYGGVQLEFFDDPEGPGCATVLEVEASATEVLDHYRGVFEEEDWDVSVQEDALVEVPRAPRSSSSSPTEVGPR